MILPLFVAGCLAATPTPTEPPTTSAVQVVCDETRETRNKVASDVARTLDDALAVSAAQLVILIDAACARE